MKYFLTLLLVCGLFGCSSSSPVASVGCTIETTIATALTTTIATTLTCTNTTQIQSDIMGAFGKTNLCSKSLAPAEVTSKGVIGSLACPIAVNAIMGLAATKIPTSWGCSPTATTAALSTALSAACIAVVPFDKVK